MNTPSILIFAKTQHSKTPYDQWLEGTGITPILLTPKEFSAGYSHLPHVYVFENYDQNQRVEQKALEIARSHSLTGVFARAEADVLRAARLRELMGIQGQKLESAMAYRNKYVMKKHLKNAGVILPEYELLESAYTAIHFIEKHGYPCVIKPLSESGSSGVQILWKQDDFDRYLEAPYRGETEIESYVDGPMFHVDGLIINDSLRFIHPFQYVSDCLAYRKNSIGGSWALNPSNPLYPLLIEAAKKVVQALPGTKNMAFHAEFWQRPDGQIVFCEIASRTGGGMISSSIEHCFDLNLDQEWFFAECGIPRPKREFSFKGGGSVIIPPQVGVLEQFPTVDKPSFMRQTVFSGKEGDRFKGGVKSGLFLAGYVIDGGSEEEVKHNIFEAASWFAQNTRWKDEQL